MKRPLACFGFSLFAVLLCLNIFESTAVSVSLFALGVVLFAVSLIIRKLRQTLILPTVIFAAVMACLLFTFFQNNYIRIVECVGDNVSVVGKITERPTFSRENQRYYGVLKAEEVNGKNVSCKLRFSFSESFDGINPADFEIGDRVTFSGTVYKAGKSSTASARYYKSRGIYLGAYSVEKLKITKLYQRPLGYYVDYIRSNIISALMHDFDNKEASLMVALLTGNKDSMDDEIYDNFVEAGIVHIMAVSGLHLSVWVGFLSLFMDFRGKKGKLLAVVMIVFTVFMMNFASFSGSVKRASAMTILYFIGKIAGKRTDALNSLGFAAVFSLLLDPFSVLDISFLLSFVSTLGIILMGVPLSEKMISKINISYERTRKLLSPFIATFALSLSVVFFIFPVSVVYFGGVSFVAPLTNLFVFAAVSPLLLMTGFYTFLRFVPFVSPVMAVIMKSFSSYIIRVADIASDSSFAYVNTRFENLGAWFLVAFVFLFAAMLLYNYDRILMKVSAIIAIGIFMLSFSFSTCSSIDKCKITVYGESRGSCAVVTLNGKGVLLGFDGDRYDEEEIVCDAESDRVKIDGAFFTKDFIDNGKASLCSALGAENIFTSDGAGAVLFERVTVSKNGDNITVDASEIKTEIFYKEYLQDEDKYDTIESNDGIYTFYFGGKNPYTVTVITAGGEKDG